MKMVFTSGQVARICKVARRTVNKWFDSGRLRGNRLPGSQERRIPREHLISFMKEYAYDMSILEEDLSKILLVGSDETTRTILEEAFPAGQFKIEVATNVSETGIQLMSMDPCCVMVDFAIGQIEMAGVLKTLRDDPSFANFVLIGLAGDVTGVERSWFSQVFRKPIEADQLVKRTMEILSRRQLL